MSLKFVRLTRPAIRKTQPGDKLTEHGITFERLPDSDGRYSVNIMVDGQRVHRVIGKESEGVTRSQAENFIEQARTDARSGRLNLPKRRKVVLRFDKAIYRYLDKLEEEGKTDTHKKRTRIELHLVPFFKNRPIISITTFDIERYKNHRKKEGAKDATINNDLAVMSHFYTKAVEWKWLEHKPCTIKRLKLDNAKIVYLTNSQVQRLVEIARSDRSPIIYPFILIALETAMRRMEILSIRIEHIDVDRCIIFVPEAKAGSRLQPMTQDLAGFLKTYLVQSVLPGQVWLFPADSASGHAMDVKKAFARVVQEAGLDKREVTPHTLRHTAITHLVQAGVDLPTVQRISGHKTLDMVLRYSHQNNEHVQSAIDKLSGRYRGVS